MRFHWSGSVGKQELTITDDYGYANGRYYSGTIGYDLYGNPIPEKRRRKQNYLELGGDFL